MVSKQAFGHFFKAPTVAGLCLTVALGLACSKSAGAESKKTTEVSPAAEQALPAPDTLLLLVRTTIVALNQANFTGNYSVLHRSRDAAAANNKFTGPACHCFHQIARTAPRSLARVIAFSRPYRTSERSQRRHPSAGRNLSDEPCADIVRNGLQTHSGHLAHRRFVGHNGAISDRIKFAEKGSLRCAQDQLGTEDQGTFICPLGSEAVFIPHWPKVCSGSTADPGIRGANRLLISKD